MKNITIFNPKLRYIILPVLILTQDGKRHKLKALLDTGAPATEFSDEALEFLGFFNKVKQDIDLKDGLQTQKHGKVILPQIEICSHPVNDLEVYVSHFEKSWGIKALIGLDFFRQFRVTIDYKAGQIITEPLAT